MPLTGIWAKSQPSIAGLVFDAVLDEADELQTDVSRFPIEDGSIGNDFAVTQNQRFTMTVAVSDNPIRALAAQASQQSVLDSINEIGLSDGTISTILSGAASVAAGSVLSALGGRNAALAGLGASILQASYAAGQAMTRSGTVLENIRNIQRRNEIFTLTTSKGAYPNCIITNTRRRTDKANEQGLELVVELEQLRIMNTTRRARFTGFENAGVPAQGEDTASTMAQGKSDRGLVGIVEVVPSG